MNLQSHRSIDAVHEPAEGHSPLTRSLFGLPGEPPHERVLLVADEATGLKAIIAVHDTARGPAFGGCRFWRYDSEMAALNDALRLSQGMSLKNALADLPFGGGKAVIIKPAGDFNRPELFSAFGRAVQSLSGVYITAEDVGTTTDDMLGMREHTAFVSGIPRGDAFGGDPSPKTAWGVFVSIKAGVRRHLHRESLDGVRIALQGLGAVGWHLAGFLHLEGAKLVVADVDPSRTARAQEVFGAEVVPADRILAADVDVLAPCALGAVFDAHSVPQVRARLISGAANNQLATPADGDALHARGILYLPDYLVNAGGIVSVAREYRNEGDEHAVMAEVSQIADRVEVLLQRAADSGLPPAREADAWARSKLVQCSTLSAT